MKSLLVLLFAAAIIFTLSCDKDNPEGPNDLGGNTDLELTRPGSEIGVSFEFEGLNNDNLSQIKDSVVIIKNDNGIITTKGQFELNIDQFMALDTLFGTSPLPMTTKLAYIDTYLKKFGASLDTSDKQHIRVDVELKNKVTSDGIQGFVNSGGDLSKPFTIVKYASNVGDKYEFTTADGTTLTRTVVSKSETEDWELSFWTVKTIRVEELLKDDPLIEKITYVANHKFGLVGVILKYKSGKEMKLTLLSWSVL